MSFHRNLVASIGTTTPTTNEHNRLVALAEANTSSWLHSFLEYEHGCAYLGYYKAVPPPDFDEWLSHYEF